MTGVEIGWTREDVEEYADGLGLTIYYDNGVLHVEHYGTEYICFFDENDILIDVQ